MLFNSYAFVVVFLPSTLAVYAALAALRGGLALPWLLLASLGFYAYWYPPYLLLILASIAGNYLAACAVAARPQERAPLLAGVAFNLALLGYFKYRNFVVESAAALAGAEVELAALALPLGISFFTFQQIAYLVDLRGRRAPLAGPLDYGLFVTFFPQLIAGPIVHHAEIMPQFRRRRTPAQVGDDAAVGLLLFAVGLFKKVVLADSIAAYATPVFAAAAEGERLDLVLAWTGALAYTFQLYFDFSGYSDMAIGAARLFGVRLPWNFNAPYAATNITEFWRRWHMTLSRFLRDYLYIPLGGNRRGRARRYANLMVTMLLGGLWHGAGWTFVAWGALHGLYLAVNHLWHGLRRRLGHDLSRESAAGRLLGGALTFFAVVVAWVFFRAESFAAAGGMLAAMAGAHGLGFEPWWLALRDTAGEALQMSARRVLLGPLGIVSVPQAELPVVGGVALYALFPVLFALAVLGPTSQRLCEDLVREEGPGAWPPWARTAVTAMIAFGFLMAFARLSGLSEFLYFQF